MFPICRSLRVMSWRHRGPMESATTWTPSQPCGMQMLTSERVIDKCHAIGRNLPIAPAQIGKLVLTLVPAGTTEYIAVGDSQAAVPVRTEVGRDFDLQWKMASSLSYLLLQLGSNDREASLPEKGTTEAKSCPKGGNMWRQSYGLTQPGAVLHTTGPWVRSYLGVGRRAASRAWQRALSKGRHGFTVRETLRWKNTHMGLPEGNQAIRTPSPVQGLTGDPGELTPVLGLASDCSAQSDCRGCWRNSTRVHRPGNWTGGGKRWGWGGMAQ